MKDDTIITSTDNAQIKSVTKLIKNAKARRTEGAFVVEGLRLASECPHEKVREIYVTPTFYEEHSDMLTGMTVKLVSDKVMSHMSDTVTPQGIIAVVNMTHYNPEQMLTTDTPPAFIILENLQDPGNLGTIIRMAEGAGISGIIMSKDTVDVYNPKVVRSTMGSIFRVPFAYVDSLPDTIKLLKLKGVTVYAGHLDGANLYDSIFTTPTAIMIGNEGNGLTDEIAKLADKRIRIPMYGKVESLNAAMAATVISYEILRQRQ